MAYLGVMINHLEETPGVLVRDLKELFPDDWHPRNTDHNRTQIGKYIANVTKLSCWLKPRFDERPASLISFTANEIDVLKQKLRQIKIEKGIIVEDAEVQSTSEASSSTAATNSSSPAVTSTPLTNAESQPANLVSLTANESTNAKKKQKLTAMSIKDPALSNLPEIKEEEQIIGDISADVDFSPVEDISLKTYVKETSDAPLSSTKDEMYKDIISRMEKMEVFYPVLVNHLMDELDINLEQWLSCSNEERDEWRKYYDPKDVLREILS
jgi:hypothetical protein